MMQDLIPLLSFAAGLLIGALLVWLAVRGRAAALATTFKALAAESLNSNNEAFLHLAEQRLKQTTQEVDQKSTAIGEMVKPVQDTLVKMNEHIHALEVKREGAYRELAEMVTASRETQNQLRHETGQLLQALRAPTGRGRWGELQLQRILEMTGMSVHADDFTTQTTITNADGPNIRPDVIVHLPGKRSIVIDSKVPLMAYLDATQTASVAERAASLKQHAKQLRDHIKTLGGKAYWEQVEGTPEFVVLFLPGEHFLGAALDADPDLMEYSTAQKVILATPMTLIALLRTVAYGWRQEALQDNVRAIANLGGKLYGSLMIFTKQLEQLGSKLGGAVETYNKTVGALERNVISSARQLSDFGTAGSEEPLPILDPVERAPRIITVAKDSGEAA